MFAARPVSPLIAACKSLTSVGKLIALGCTMVSTETRVRSLVRSAPLSCATRRLSANSNSSLSPSRFLQWLRSRALVRNMKPESKNTH
jgi:hypothetical protein